MKPNSLGHDSWGFRNVSIPDHADIVAIGDSNTYGVSAISRKSWPAFLQKFTGRSVYNMGMPGYAPVAYLNLLRTKALQLNPSQAIIGFYLGNDIFGAYKDVYRRKHAPYLKNPDFISDSIEARVDIDNPIMVKMLPLANVRIWLSHNSVLYNLLRFSDIAYLLQNKFDIQSDTSHVILEESDNHIHTALQHQGLHAVNLNNSAVREGLRISLSIISELSELCQDNEIDFLVVLIPSKVAVYSEHIKMHPEIEHFKQFIDYITNEARISMVIKTYCQEHNIPCLDSLPPLQNKTCSEQVYPANADTHPSHKGYRIIARSIAEYLAREQSLTEKKAAAKK